MGKLIFAKVVKSYPRFDAPEDIRDQDELKAWWEKQWNQDRDVLHQIQFYRVGKVTALPSCLTTLMSSIVLDGRCRLVGWISCTNNNGQNLK